mmetsp:Transcript_7570/g.19601  ORF Transcript_7570/g.19601 Transcript_7570/m.19601 type:complete len:238 (+) Transcript_7570:214-927(+)
MVAGREGYNSGVLQLFAEVGGDSTIGEPVADDDEARARFIPLQRRCEVWGQGGDAEGASLVVDLLVAGVGRGAHLDLAQFIFSWLATRLTLYMSDTLAALAPLVTGLAANDEPAPARGQPTRASQLLPQVPPPPTPAPEPAADVREQIMRDLSKMQPSFFFEDSQWLTPVTRAELKEVATGREAGLELTRTTRMPVVDLVRRCGGSLQRLLSVLEFRWSFDNWSFNGHVKKGIIINE